MENNSKIIGKVRIISIILKDIFISIGVFFFILMEELVWDTFVVPVRKYFEKIISKKIKKFISKQNKYIIMFIFLLPFLTSELMGLVSGVLFTMGFILFAVTIYILKIVVASASFWVFSNNKEKLLSISIFEKSYTFVIHMFNYLKSIKIYKDIKKVVADIKEAGRSNTISILKRKYKSYKNKFKKKS